MHDLNAEIELYDATTGGTNAEGVRVSEAQPANGELPKWHDATIMTAFDPADYNRQIVATVGRHCRDMKWQRKTFSEIALIKSFCQHVEGSKDGPAFVLGDMVSGQRLKTAVKSLHGVGLDIDTGTPSAIVDAALAKLGCCAVRYTTHSHAKTKSEIKKDKIAKFANGREIDSDLILAFLREVEQWDPTIADNAEYVGTEHTERGIACVIQHPPMPKHRVVLLFAEPFVIENEAPTQAEAMKKWAKVPKAFAGLLGVPFDTSCTDPSRLFYFPRHAKGAPFEISLFGGPYFDWRTLELDNPLERVVADLNKGKSKSVTDGGRELGGWHKKRGHGFQIADVLQDHAPDRIRHDTGHGLEIACPFDEDHSNAGDPEDRACLAVNATQGQSEFFTISCRHESCRNKTMLDMLGKMLADGWFGADVLEDENYNAIIEEGDKAEGQMPAVAPPEKENFNFYTEAELVTYLDSICRVVALGGQRKFVFLGRDGEPQFLTRDGASIELAQFKFWRNKGTDEKPDWVSQPAFNVWLQSSERKPNFSGAVFDPNLKTGEIGNGLLNLWTGFAVQPRLGSWEKLKAHIRENICSGNGDLYHYLMGWTAQLFQEPGRKSGIAVVLRGDIGVGKTKFFEWIGNIIGDRHAIVADKAEQCTGKFNAALEQNIFISAEEAFFAGDPAQKGPLKHLVTGHKLMYEPKGRDAYMGRNYSRLGMTTNERWAVPAVRRERRYLVLDVAPTRQKQKAYFIAIDDEMKNGGAEAMLHDMLAYDYSDIDFQNPPMTDALNDIIRRGIDTNEKWLQDVLSDGRFPVRPDSRRDEIEWEEHGCEVQKADVVASYNDFVPSFKKVPADAQDVQLFLRERIGALVSAKMTIGEGRLSKRVPSWRLPPLSEARAAYSEVSGFVFEPEDPKQE